MAEGDIDYLTNNNTDCEIEDSEGTDQRATLVATPGGFGGLGTETTFGELSTAENRVHTGWTFAYNINPGVIRELTINGGTISHVGNMAVVDSGSNPAGVAFIRTDGCISYTPGIGAIVRFTAIFDTPQADSQQLIGIGDNSDGWFFGYNGLSFGIMRRAKSVDTWYPQAEWSENTLPELDHTKGNVYQISFQWLGFGMQYFGIENSNSGNIEEVHRIKYANLNTETSVDIPSLPIAMGVSNSGNTIPITLRSPSAVAMSQGEAFPEAFTTLVGYDLIATPIIVGDNYLFSIINPGTYESKDNKLYLEPILLTISNEGGKAVTFTVYLNATLTAPSFSDIATGITPAQADTAATAYSGGLEILSIVLSRDDSTQIDLKNLLDARQWADNTLTIAANATAVGSDVSIGYTFRSRI